VTNLLIVLPIVLVSMTIHEMMHAFTSHWLGDDTAYLQGRVSLNPLKHIDPFLTILLPVILVILNVPPFGAAKPVQVNFSRLKYDEFGGAIVGMVGPLTNLALAVLAALIFRHSVPTSELWIKILSYSVLVNVGFFIFNSIPWPPLDGSRLLYAFAPKPLQGFMESIEKMGMNGLILFMFVFFVLLSVPLSNVILHFSNWLLGISIFAVV